MEKKIFILTTLFTIGIMKSQVGIQTSNPSATLDVISSGSTSSTKALEINNSSATEMVTVLDNGNVGIGINAPNNPLDISSGNSQFPIALNIRSTTHATSRRAAQKIGNWLLLQDIDGNGTQNFSIYGGSTASNIFNINPAGNVGIGVNNPSVLLDTRKNGIADQIGVGTTSPGNLTPATAATAGAGALTYSTASGGTLVYSNGTNWNTLTSNVQKSVVIASLPAGSYNFISGNFSDVTGWAETVDVNSNFTPSTGVFIAPRAGNYSISCSLLPIAASNTGGQFEVHVNVNGTDMAVGLQSGNTTGTPFTGATVSTVIKLNAGDDVRIKYFHNLGSNRVSHGNAFNTLSIAEL